MNQTNDYAELNLQYLTYNTTNPPPSRPSLAINQLNLQYHQTILPCLTHFDDVRQLWLYVKPRHHLLLDTITKPTQSGLEGTRRVTCPGVLLTVPAPHVRTQSNQL